jgi:hypothetical protein
MLESFTMMLSVDCRACRMSLPVNGIVASIRCYHCGDVNPLDAEYWVGAFEPAYFAEALGFEQGEGRTVTSLGGSSSRIAYGRRTPRCQACKGPDLDLDRLATLVAGGRCFCPACGQQIRIRAADPLCTAINPWARFVVHEETEDDATRALQQRTQPVLFACMGCGGGLQVDGSIRAVACSYCGNSNFLPDGLWNQLHPVPKPQAFFLVCEYDASARLQARWADDDLRAQDAALPHLTPEQLAYLARDAESEVRKAVGGNRAAPPEVMWQLAHDDDYEVRAAVAGNPAAPPQALAKLADDDDSDVVGALAANPSLPAQVVEHLARSDDYGKRVAAANHPAVSIDTLKRLARDDDSDVERAAKGRLAALKGR